MYDKDFPITLGGMYLYLVKDEDGSAFLYDREPILIKGHNEYIGPSGCNSYFLTPREVGSLPQGLRDAQPNKPVPVVINAIIDSVFINNERNH